MRHREPSLKAKGQSKDFKTKEMFVGEITSTVNEGWLVFAVYILLFSCLYVWEASFLVGKV